VNTDTIKLEQAQAAREDANWSLVIQCLQQLILEAGSKVDLFERSKRSQILDLALEVLLWGDFHQRWDIAKMFPRIGEMAIAPLIEILTEEEDEELCWFAGRILGDFNHPTAITALVEVIKTTASEELRSICAASLGQIGSNAIAALTELLADEDTRLIAVTSLAYIRNSETIPPLISVVQSPQSAVRAAAIEALSSFHDSQIPPILLNALDDISAAVRREAVLGLGFRRDLREELNLVNRLLPLLHDFNINVCSATAIALGRLGTDPAAIGLYQVLQSAYTPDALQLEIIRALGRIGTDLAGEYLHSYLQQSRSVRICQEIITILGRVTTQVKVTTEVLIEMLHSSHPATNYPSVKGAIALSLGYLGELQAMDVLTELLADPDMSVKLHAIAALKQLAPETAHQQLQQLATNTTLQPDLQQGVAIALSEW